MPSTFIPKVAEEGIHMDGSSVGMVDISGSDLKLVPDLSSLSVLPQGLFQTKAARMMCDIYEPDSERTFDSDLWSVLWWVIVESIKVLGARATYNACSVILYFLFSRDQDGNLRRQDEGGYLASPPADMGVDVRLEVVKNLSESGVVVEKHHHEVPPRKYELNLQ